MWSGLMSDKKEYLKEWRKKKKEDDPEYFLLAGRKAAEVRKKKLKDNPDLMAKERERSRKYSAKKRKEDPRKSMLNDARRRSKKKSIEFNLKLSDIFIPEVCPVLGIPLFITGGKRTDNSPSLDRVDNTRGYCKDNVMVISARANNLKNDGTLDEFKLIIKYMENFDGLVRD